MKKIFFIFVSMTLFSAFLTNCKKEKKDNTPAMAAAVMMMGSSGGGGCSGNKVALSGTLLEGVFNPEAPPPTSSEAPTGISAAKVSIGGTTAETNTNGNMSTELCLSSATETLNAVVTKSDGSSLGGFSLQIVTDKSSESAVVSVTTPPTTFTLVDVSVNYITGPAGDTTPTLDFSDSYLYSDSRTVATNLSILERIFKPRAATSLDVQLKYTNKSTGTTNAQKPIVLKIDVDESTNKVTVNSTHVFEVGTYDFEIDFTLGSGASARRYVGVANNYLLNNSDKKTINFPIRPMLGTITGAVDIKKLAQFRFQYQADELAKLQDPKIGIRIDGGSESIYNISKVTGASYCWMNITPGSRNLQLRLYDGNAQIGKSREEQENQTIVGGKNVTIDLIPFHAEATYTMTASNGPAIFKFNVSDDIIREVGGLSNLQILFGISGAQTNVETTASVVKNTSTNKYEATVEFQNGVYFETVSTTIKVNDLTKVVADRLIGHCATSNIVLTSSNAERIYCEMTLLNRAVIGGSIMGVLAVNVFDTNNPVNPVKGANIYANGKLVGQTGSGNFGTSGYLKVFLTKGEYTIRAESPSGGKYGTTTLTVEPLGLYNKDITLNQSIVPTNGLVAYYSFDTNATDGSGKGNNGYVYGSVDFVAGKKGNAAKFKGMGTNPTSNYGYSSRFHSFIYVPNSSTLQFTNSMTVSAYVMIDDASGMGTHGTGTAGRYTSYGVHTLISKYCFQVGHSSTFYVAGDKIYTTISSPQDKYGKTSFNKKVGEWFHIAYTYTNGVLKVYIDGNLVSQATTNLELSRANNQYLLIGMNQSAWWYPMNGKIDELRIYNTALTDAEIKQLSEN
jgi:hypothetical protein